MKKTLVEALPDECRDALRIRQALARHRSEKAQARGECGDAWGALRGAGKAMGVPGVQMREGS